MTNAQVVEVTVPVAVSAGAGGAASEALGKLSIGNSVCFEIHSAHLSHVGGILDQTIQGSMAVMSEGRKVATMAFSSAQRGRHLSASLALPSGVVIATFEQGQPPKKDGAGGLFNAIRSDYSFSAAPPVAIGLLGQPHGSFKALGIGVPYNALAEGSEFHHVSGAMAAKTRQGELGTCCFCLPNGYKITSRKKSLLGKKEVPLPVLIGDGTAEKEKGVVHLVLEGPKLPRELRSTMAAHEVICEFGGGCGEREQLDILLMGAAMAAINVTAKEISSS